MSKLARPPTVPAWIINLISKNPIPTPFPLLNIHNMNGLLSRSLPARRFEGDDVHFKRNAWKKNHERRS